MIEQSKIQNSLDSTECFGESGSGHQMTEVRDQKSEISSERSAGGSGEN
jgi:hypothetical protein